MKSKCSPVYFKGWHYFLGVLKKIAARWQQCARKSRNSPFLLFPALCFELQGWFPMACSACALPSGNSCRQLHQHKNGARAILANLQRRRRGVRIRASARKERHWDRRNLLQSFGSAIRTSEVRGEFCQTLSTFSGLVKFSDKKINIAKIPLFSRTPWFLWYNLAAAT